LRRTSRTSKLGPIGKQFPFLWNLSGKLVHKALGGQVIRASEVQAAFWPEDRLRWPCAPESKIHSDVPRESVFIAADFPVPELREHPGMTPRSGRIGTSDPVEKSGSRRIPCIFPVDQRIGSRDEFAPDCLHRHSVCGSRRLPVCIEGSAENFPRFRGPWPFRSGGSEPETAGSDRGRRRLRRLSLLASWAVRIRF
jgi:hypothetical protein